jgi:uncharacterized protein (DUF2147 family)
MMQMTSIFRMTLRVTLAATLMAAIGPSVAATSVDPGGTWLSEDGRARIRVERCGVKREQICGFIVWMKEPGDAKGNPVTDIRNPDLAKRARPLLGHQLIMGLAQNSEGHFAGQIYNAENGKSYEITLWRESADKLKVRGCMLSLLCATQVWTQTMNALPGQLVGMTGDPTGPKPDKEWAQEAKVKPIAAARLNK